MLSKEDFVRRIFDGAAPTPKKASKAAQSPATFSADDVFGGDDTTPASTWPPADTRFAQLLLEEVFGHGEALDRDEVVLGEQKTRRLLPNGGRYWPNKERPFHIVLFELDKKGRELLADGLFSKNDLLEDALHRIIQDVLDGFEKPKRAASTRLGAQTETLCVVSIIDDRNSTSGRQLVCFGTKSTETKALEVFTLREEVRDWDRPLAEEHLNQLFERHFKKLENGTKWQEAFITGPERKKILALLAECKKPRLFDTQQELLKTLRAVLDEIAGSFGIWKKGANQDRRVEMDELPSNHGIGVDPSEPQKPGFKNPLQGVRIYDRDRRLLGFIVYVAASKIDVETLQDALKTFNHFHNVLVIYPDSAEPKLELWQGDTILRGRLTEGTRRSVFDGEGGVVQLLSRFFVVSKTAIEKPKQLATELAWRAQHLKALAVEELEKEIAAGNDKGPLKKLFDTFNAALATLTVEKFADAYAQTITYGMLAARWLSSENENKPLFTRKNFKDLLPETSAFLKDLFDKLVNSNFDKNLSWLLDDITSLLARTSVAQVFQDEKRDPSIHFYEDFLDAYDPQVRKDQGVYYTPDEVVSYIVRTAHASLQNDFGLPLGLADTTTTVDFAKAKNFKVPEGVDPNDPFVQVLDPALGTGTFLLRVIEVIRNTMQTEFKKQGLDEKAARKAWVSYVRRDLLPRINGFELMMAPYIVSHLRLGLALQETGFTFTKNDRLRIFLTNSLEPHTAAQLSFIGEHVAEEAKEAERAKKAIRVTVVVGNPPYAGHSQNNGEWARGLVEPYRSIDGKALRLAQGKWLQNDYVKFIAYAEGRLAATGFGVLGFITDHSYLDGDTFPGLRHHLLTTFSNVDVLNLHGNLARREAPPDGGADDNVFNIMQGVAILCARRTPDAAADGLATFRTADLWGARGPKLQRLHAASEGLSPIVWLTEVHHNERFLFLATRSSRDASFEFAQFDAIDAVFSPNGRPAPGFLTTHDDFAIGFTREEISDHVTTLLATRSEADARDHFKLCTQAQWQYASAHKALANGAWREQLVSCLYRPFDERWTVYDPSVLVHRRERVNAHLLEPGNVALLTTRMTKGDDFNHVFLSDKITEVISLSSKTSANAFVFPLFLRERDALVKRNQPNIDRQILRAYAEIAGKAATPMAMFEYWYAILSSPSYRRRYNELLIREFPRVPRPSSAEVFKALGEHGKRLVELHLLKTSPKSLGANNGLQGKGDGVVAPGMPKFDAKEGKIWINPKQWFAGTAAVWGFKIGSYEVCKKWLAARRGRSLSSDESRRFVLVLNTLRETIEEQSKIDRTIETYGGWPDAFRLFGSAVATASLAAEDADE